MKKTSTSSKCILGNVLLVLGSISILAAVMEGMLTLFLPVPIVWKDPQETYVNDPVTGYKLAPLQTSFTHSYSVRTNSHGFRGREVAVNRPPDAVRILCLGDSLTFGAGVPEDGTYPSQLETLLNAQRPSRYEVINTGVPGYDTWQEVAFFRKYGITFRPDLVIIGFYANDVVPKPNIVPELVANAGSLKRQGFARFIPDSLIHMFKRSRLLLLLRDRYVKLANQFMPSREFTHQRALLDGTTDEFNERGWMEVEYSLKEMSELRTAGKFHLLLAIFPIAEQLLHQYSNAQYQSRLKVLAEKYAIPTIDLKPAFEREFQEFGSLFIEWDGHPNATAFSIAAKEIERFVVQTLEHHE